MDQDEYRFKLMQWYSDSAKSYTQISAAALLLPVFLVRQVVGVAEDQPMNLKWPLYASWFSFLLSIVCGLMYQYVAIKHVQTALEKKDNGFVLVRRPRYIYGTMLLAFLIGAAFFVVGAGMQLNWFLKK